MSARDLLSVSGPATPPASPPVWGRRCADCAHHSRAGTCREPVAAGRTRHHGIRWPGPVNVATCPAFAAQRQDGPQDRATFAEPLHHQCADDGAAKGSSGAFLTAGGWPCDDGPQPVITVTTLARVGLFCITWSLPDQPRPEAMTRAGERLAAQAVARWAAGWKHHPGMPWSAVLTSGAAFGLLWRVPQSVAAEGLQLAQFHLPSARVQGAGLAVLTAGGERNEPPTRSEVWPAPGSL